MISLCAANGGTAGGSSGKIPDVDFNENTIFTDEPGYARVIDRSIEGNEPLSEKEKIHVIAIAKGYSLGNDQTMNKEIGKNRPGGKSGGC